MQAFADIFFGLDKYAKFDLFVLILSKLIELYDKF